MARRAAGMTLAGVVLVSAGCRRRLPERQRLRPAGALVEEPCVGIPVTEARCLHLTVPRIRPRVAAAPSPSASSCSRHGNGSGRGRDRVSGRRPRTGGDGAHRRLVSGRRRVARTARRRVRRPARHRRLESAHVSVLRSARSAADLLRHVSADPESAGLPIARSSRPPTWRNTRRARRSRTWKRSGSRWNTRSSRSSAGPTARAWRWSTSGATSRASAPSILESPVTPATHAPERFGQFAARALDGLIDECLATSECARAFPAIREEARQVFDRLRQGSVTATVAHPYSERPGAGHAHARSRRRGHPLHDVLVGRARRACRCTCTRRSTATTRRSPTS